MSHSMNLIRSQIYLGLQHLQWYALQRFIRVRHECGRLWNNCNQRITRKLAVHCLRKKPPVISIMLNSVFWIHYHSACEITCYQWPTMWRNTVFEVLGNVCTLWGGWSYGWKKRGTIFLFFFLFGKWLSEMQSIAINTKLKQNPSKSAGAQ